MSATTMTHSPGARRGYRGDLAALATAQKPARGTAAYSRFVNRPVARRVAAAMHQIGLTPNGATAVSATLSASGLALVALVPPSWPVGVAAAGLLAAGYVMDSVDGQLARLRGRGSVAGEWLDHTVDCIKTCSLHLAVLVALYRFGSFSTELVLLLPLVFLVVDVTCFFGFQQLPLLRARAGSGPAGGSAGGATGGAAGGSVGREAPWRTWLILPTDYGLFCWMFVALAVPAAFVVVYASMLVANAGLLVLALRKWWRELVALDAGSAA